MSFINLALSLAFLGAAVVIAPILDTVDRKLRARLHSRIGPPTILQTWYDIAKLLRKEIVVSEGGSAVIIPLFMTAASTLLALTALPPGMPSPLAPLDLLYLIMFSAAAHASFILIAVSSGNVYAVIGGFREFVLVSVNEVVYVLGLTAVALSTGVLSFSGAAYYGDIRPFSYIISFILLSLCLYVSSARVPFDLGEAEPELASGVLIELSGPLLAFGIISVLLKRFLSAAVTATAIAIPVMRYFGIYGLPGFGLLLGLTIVVWVIHALIAASLGRSRVGIAVKTLIGLYIPLTLLAYTLLLLGV